MANFCDFEFRVKGKKMAVMAFYASTPWLDWKEIQYESGTDYNYEIHFKGNCKWSINFDVEDDCEGVTEDLSKYSLSQIEYIGAEYLGYSVRAKSEIFNCEVKVHYWSMESEFDQFDHYKNGLCLKKRKIAFDNYGETENFDWNTLEFIGHEGEYDESVDGEESDMNLMNALRMMPGAYVPSQKPKKNTSYYVDSSLSKNAPPFNGIVITRNKNNVVKGKGYTYIVPDGFNVGKEDGRDFTAWLPDSTFSGIDNAIIRIYPPNKKMQLNNGEDGLGEMLEYFQKSPSLCDAYQDYMCQLTKTQNIFGFKMNYEYFPTILSHTSGGCMYNRTSGYYTFLVKVLIGDHFEQFRFDVEGVNASNESSAQKLVRELADGIIPNQSFKLPEPLNSERYKASILTAGIVKEWTENFNYQLGLQAAVKNIRGKAIEEKIKAMASDGTIDRNIIINDVRRMCREYLDVVVKLVEEAIDIVGFFSHQGANKTQVTKLRSETVEYLDNNKEILVNLDAQVIREEIKDWRELKERILQADGFSVNNTINKNEDKQKRIDISRKLVNVLTSVQYLSKLNHCKYVREYKRINDRKRAEAVKQTRYDEAKAQMKTATTSKQFQDVAQIFRSLTDYYDSFELYKNCLKKSKEIQHKDNYQKAKTQMESAESDFEFANAARLFSELGDYEDSKALAEICKKKQEEKKEEIRKDAILAESKKLIDENTFTSVGDAAKKLASIKGWKDADKIFDDTYNDLKETLVNKKKRISKMQGNLLEMEECAEKRRFWFKLMLFVVFGGFVLGYAFLIPMVLSGIDSGINFIPVLIVFLIAYLSMVILTIKMYTSKANKFELLCDGKITSAVKDKAFFAKKISEKDQEIRNTRESIETLTDLIADMEAIRKKS